MSALRTTMTPLISKIRLMIADPAGASQQLSDQQIQDTLDEHRDDIWYEQLQMAPAIVNAASTNNVPSMIFADYYSVFGWWEGDVVLQGYLNNQAWKVLAPVASDYIVGHWQFETSIFTGGTYPGQYPPVFATGKIYDLHWAAADLLTYWANVLGSAYDITVNGQSLRRSQLMTAKLDLAHQYRMRARPKVAQMVRRDVAVDLQGHGVPVLGGGPDSLKRW